MNSKILFVDDEQQALKYFSKAISKDFSVLTADSVASAIAILEQQHEQIGVVITDQKMPQQRGMELLQHTHVHYPDIVRMLTTAFCDTESAIDAINSVEIFKYITKPWDLDELKEVLEQGLQRYHAHKMPPLSVAGVEQLIFSEFREDCDSWFEYASYAYGDVDVYRSGLEALANKYYRKLKTSFDAARYEPLREQIDAIIDADFLNVEVLSKMAEQHDKGFGADLYQQAPKLH